MARTNQQRIRSLYENAQQHGQNGNFAAAWELCEEAEHIASAFRDDEPARKLPIIKVR